MGEKEVKKLGIFKQDRSDPILRNMVRKSLDEVQKATDLEWEKDPLGMLVETCASVDVHGPNRIPTIRAVRKLESMGVKIIAHRKPNEGEYFIGWSVGDITNAYNSVVNRINEGRRFILAKIP